MRLLELETRAMMELMVSDRVSICPTPAMDVNNNKNAIVMVMVLGVVDGSKYQEDVGGCVYFLWLRCLFA